MKPRALLFIAVLGVIAIAHPLGAQEVVIPTEVAQRDYYPWITSLTAGPISWSGAENTDVAGYQYRAVITTSEIYSDLYIEYITLGDEGCCKRVAWARLMISDVFAEAFGLYGEFAGLRVIEWRDSDSLLLTIQERHFLLMLSPDGGLVAQEMVGQ